MATHPSRVNNRYLVHDLLGQGGMGAVYRASDRLNGQIVALKQVTVLANQFAHTPGSDSDFRLALSDEFRTLASLRHPNIISVLDYGFDAQQPYFTMELLETTATILTAGQDAPLEQQIRLLVQLLQALIYLHRRGVLHRDLKPGNILVTRDGTVKVLDFGLSLAGAYSRSNVQESTVGTLAYMAPELFSEERASVASDLYAVGVIICELIAGHHPFNQKNVAMLVSSVLTAPPDLTGLNPELVAIVSRLLAKHPDDRYSSAAEVINDLCAAAGLPSPVESSAIRESFLQAARFIGRQDELGQLREALDAIVSINAMGSTDAQNGQPPASRAWLIGGESGVGKSRLMEEVRIRALVRGALVLRGQAITESGLPYQVWREPLRRLVLSSALDDESAAVLKTLVPDIDHLLERPIPEPPPLDPQMMQNRFLKVATDLFRALNQPTLVLLEDLQWASDENLELLKRLVPLSATTSLLIVASYRDEERPNLPEILTGTQVIRLKRLDAASTGELSESMLGEVGQHPQLVSWLYRQTEGNIFFLIEIVRELADRAGELDLIQADNLPSNLLPGSIQGIVQRRLNRISEEARPLLQIAALSGRELDLNLLGAFTPDLASWLEQCNTSGVLEVEQDRWRFAHDKLREQILPGIAASALSGLHRQIAETLERIYPDDPAHIPAIAHHYQEAGIRDKAAHYLVRAANFTAENFANREAISLYKSAIEQFRILIQTDHQKEQWNRMLSDTHEPLGDVLELNGQHEDARSAYQDATALVSGEDLLRRSRLSHRIAKTWENQRQYDKALESYYEAEDVLGDSPLSPTQVWWKQWLDCKLSRMSCYYWLGNITGINEIKEKIQALVETHGTPLQRARFFSNLVASSLRHCRYHNVSEETIAYAYAGTAALQDSIDSSEKAWVIFTTGFALLWSSQLDEAESVMQESLVIAERIGDVTMQSRLLTYLTIVRRKREQVEEVKRYSERSLEIALRGQMLEYIGMAKANLAWVALREGHYDLADELAFEAFEMIQRTAQGLLFPWVALWPLVITRLNQGHIEDAITYVNHLLDPRIQPPPDELIIPLQSARQSWADNDFEGAADILYGVCDLARPLGYV